MNEKDVVISEWTAMPEQQVNIPADQIAHVELRSDSGQLILSIVVPSNRFITGIKVIGGNLDLSRMLR